MEQAAEKKSKFSPGTIILMGIVAVATAYVVYQVQYKKKTVKEAFAEIGKSLGSPTGIVAILGFIMGIGEFIITDNVNQYGFAEAAKTGKLFQVPSKDKLQSTTTTLFITSILTGVLTDLTLRLLPQEAKENVARKFLG